jgi:hypothetical protein
MYIFHKIIINKYYNFLSRKLCKSTFLKDGKIVKLEDGSVWQVDDADTVDSVLWLPITDIVACDSQLINTDDNETVSATQIH